MPESSALLSMLRLEVVEPGFRSRTYAAGQGTSTQFNLIAIVLRGNATLHVNEEAMEVVESSIAVLPHGVRARLSVPAGTGAWIIGFARPLQSLVTGTGPESLILDTILSRLTLTPGNPEILAASIAPLLPLLTDEVNDQNKRSQTAVASLVRLLLIAISRMLTSSGLADGRNDTHILHRFRQLVELGYRSRKTVTGYCQDLNLTYDRLNDICQRNLKRTPLSLIQQRILMDASTRLLKTDESIQSIANHLGFSDPTKFSHFFKRATGLSPRQYRQTMRKQEDRQASTVLQTFSDWP
ncbi:transcriptional regulatory protein [Stappia aggregata IAM 12614]|uniref:Transcriptional regulatory protein n=1 Tax=Roseibium aggregatum (strain ATCC 25650 / DSM 13394 / JCM 20685 / NBRC 16684 / NCIMB 2208 / IAM 12614 / B1) TaxID=384765 RepID=A0P002_ROSAI|nr:helix-turn-helix domain-containing protein [Roseibium aggregatum]EAV41719.1 transcriptional regulatory protein [Stappia aggregata IAM 12614] [Roseibium aggregatum IAM 12614]